MNLVYPLLMTAQVKYLKFLNKKIKPYCETVYLRISVTRTRISRGTYCKQSKYNVLVLLYSVKIFVQEKM
jgi:hypothetical protein